MFQVRTRSALLFAALVLVAFFLFFNKHPNTPSLPVVAIASPGPHESLQATVRGIREGLAGAGFVEGENIAIRVQEAHFQPSLYRPMISTLAAAHPEVLVALTTPVAQAAHSVHVPIPVLYSAVTEPETAGLASMTGASDKQNIALFLHYARTLLPQAKRVGLLYSTAESNDTALLHMLQQETQAQDMHLVAIPIDEAREIPQRMHAFKGKVDFIYVGVSGPIQPSLPAIVMEADKLRIPVFNADSHAVQAHQATGSFGVDYYQVGINTAHLIARVLNGEKTQDIPPAYPSIAEHHGFISLQKTTRLGIRIPSDIQNTTVVE